MRLLPTKSTRKGCPSTMGMVAIGGPAGGKVEPVGVPGEPGEPAADDMLPPPQPTRRATRRQAVNLMVLAVTNARYPFCSTRTQAWEYPTCARDKRGFCDSARDVERMRTLLINAAGHKHATT